MYLLLGPTLLLPATGMLIPDVSSNAVDLRREYHEFRRSYHALLSAFWLRAILLWPVFGYPFAPTVPLLVAWPLLSLLLLSTVNPPVQAFGAIGNCLVIAVFIALFAMRFGEAGRAMSP